MTKNGTYHAWHVPCKMSLVLIWLCNIKRLFVFCGGGGGGDDDDDDVVVVVFFFSKMSFLPYLTYMVVFCRLHCGHFLDDPHEYQQVNLVKENKTNVCWDIKAQLELD